MSLPTSLFDYPLPSSAIAQHPAHKRDHSKLMVVRRDKKSVEHRKFYELPEILSELPCKMVFFRNTARVIRGRLWLKRKSGATIELLLLRPSTEPTLWWCLAKPLKKLMPGETLSSESLPIADLKERSLTGEALFKFSVNPLALSEKIGVLPLPPYIAREPHDKNETKDAVRYQTVYAREPVAAAAPTAGLHFTTELISELESKGHRFADLTLHIGLDTFRPITTPTIEEHKIHTEEYHISEKATYALKDVSHRYSRLAVGTTSLRTMEDYTRNGFPKKDSHSAALFIYPPQTITSADALITNFHLPKSTLLCLVAAFLTPGSTEGIEWLKILYTEALQKDYRFYSYGDAMLIL